MLPRHRSKMIKTEKKVISWLCSITFLGIAIGAIANFVWFKVNPEPRFLPFGSQLPDQEIVFAFDPYGDLEDSIGFIKSDGTNLETRSYEIPNPLFYSIDLVKQYDHSSGRIFSWSLDGQSVGGISPSWKTNGQGYPIIIENDGNILFCEPEETIIALNSILIISPMKIMAIELYPDSEKRELVIYDMSSCQIENVVYSSEENENISSFSYNNNGLLALETYSPSFSGVRLYDDAMKNIKEIPGAKWPAISKDGLEIAYINDTSQLCIDSIMESDQSTCFGNAQNGVSWSPDSKWLVFSNAYNQVVILEISTGEETVIAEGYWPDWRPSAPSQ